MNAGIQQWRSGRGARRGVASLTSGQSEPQFTGNNAITYLLGPFRFSVDQAAPLPSPYTEAGAVGALTLADVGNHLSVAGGKLVNDTNAADARGVYASAALGRVAGRAYIATWRRSSGGANSYPFIGWLTGAGIPSVGTTQLGFYVSGVALSVVANNTDLGNRLTIAVDTDYEFCLLLRGTGGSVLYRPTPGSGIWTILWVGEAGSTATLTPAARFVSPATLDDLRVTDLGGMFATDYGIATDRKAISANGDTLTMQADALVEHTITAATGVTQELSVRRTDDNNRWIVRMDQAVGTIKLIEVVAGVETERASSAQTWTNGTPYRVVVICAGTTITPYVANVAKTGYASAASNQAATGAKVSHAGVDLVSWPRTVSLPAGA